VAREKRTSEDIERGFVTGTAFPPSNILGMSRRVLTNEEAERLAAAVIAADRLSDDEIGRIADAPHMLSAIRSRIERDGVVRAEKAHVPRRMLAFGTAAASVLMAATAVWLWPAKQPAAPAALHARQITPPAPEKHFDAPAARPAPAKAVDERPERQPRRSVSPADREPVRPRAELASYSPGKAARPAEFYAIGGAANPSEKFSEGRIVRVELPRASLLSLGVDVPLDSDRPTVKADLLVGPDGVTKGFRLVE
jgi:hypothetical protein